MNIVLRLALVAIVLFPGFLFAQSADQEVVSVVDAPDPVTPGQNLTYTVTLRNNGPDPATNGGLNINLGGSLTHQSTIAPAGFTCLYAGSNGSCTNPSFAAGSTVVFTIVVQVDASLVNFPDGTLTSNFFPSGVTPDPNNGNNSKSASTTYDSPQVDLVLTASDSPDPVAPDGDITYTVNVTNNGPDAATNGILNVALNNTLRFTSIVVPAGWSCSPPAVGAGTSFSCTTPTVASGPTSTFTIVLRANDEQFGLNDQTINQFFSVSATGNETNNGNNSITVSTQYNAPDADLTLSMTDAPDPFIPGGNVTYTMTLMNNGPDTAANVQLTGTLNASLRFQSLSAPAGFSCTTPAVGATGTITCTAASMANGVSGIFTLVTQGLPSLGGGGAIMQSFSASSATNDPAPFNNTTSQETSYLLTASTFVFDLSGAQEVPPVATIARGGCFGLFDAGSSQLVVTCVHDLATATAMHIHRAAAGTNGPIAFDFGNPASPVTATWSGMTPADVADLLAGNLYVNIHSAARPGGEIRGQILPRTVDLVAFTANGAQVVPPDPTGATANCTADLNSAASAVAVSCTHNLASPDIARMHEGPEGVNGPDFYTFSSAASPISDLVPLNVQQVAAFAGGFLYLEITSTGVATIRGQIGALAPPPPAADLTITKTTGATSATHGGAIAYTISVTNAGPDAATAVTLTDTLPASLLFQSIVPAAGFTCTTPSVGSSGTITCNAASLANGATASFTLNVTVAQAATGTIANTASVSSAVTDPNPGNSIFTTSAIPVVLSADLAIVKTTATTSAPVGSTFSYTITVTNAGPDAASSVVLTDTLPATLLFESIVPAAGFACPGLPTIGATGTITCNAATLASGASAVFTLTVRVASGATGTVANTATVTSATFDPNAANGSGFAPGVAVTASADLSVTKSVNTTVAPSGSDVTYTIVVTNNGPSTATNVVVTDPVSGALTLLSATPTQGTCSGAPTVTCSIGTLTVGQSATVTLVARVIAPNGTQIANTATASATEPDANPANNAAPAAAIGVSAGANVPTLSEWMMLLLAALLALVAVIRTA